MPDFSKIIYASSRALSKFVRPLRSALYRRRTAPFVRRGARGLLFELHPNQEIDRHIAIDGIYERRYLRYLETLIPDEAVVLDVGANIGNHALYFSRKALEVHCFEPNPAALERLARNISLNDARNIHVHPFGLSNQSSVARFAEVDGNLGMTRHSDTGDHEFVVRRGDEVVEMDRIDLIKVDVEGMEPNVLAGLAGTIAKHRPIIAFEYSGQGWDTIRAALDDYRVVEPVYARGMAIFTAGEVAEFRPIDVPESRWYEALIAFPNR